MPEFYCLLAKAMDYDELRRYSEWVSMGNKPAKFKWSSVDRAGTRPLHINQGDAPSFALAKRLEQIMKHPDTMGRGQLVRGGWKVAAAIAAHQDRDMAFICPDTYTRDKNGKIIERGVEHFPYALTPEEFEEWQSSLSIQHE